MEDQAPTAAVPASLLQTVGVMSHIVRTMRYMEKRLSELMQSSDLDPRLRTEMQRVQDATAQVMMSLSLMGVTVADVLKEAIQDQSSGRKPCGGGDRIDGVPEKEESRASLPRQWGDDIDPWCSED